MQNERNNNAATRRYKANSPWGKTLVDHHDILQAEPLSLDDVQKPFPGSQHERVAYVDVFFPCDSPPTVGATEETGPPTVGATEETGPPTVGATEETGPRVRVTLITALPKDHDVNYDSMRAVKCFQARLTQVAGGFTKDEVRGSWKDGNGGMVIESGYRYTVSLPVVFDGDDNVNWMATYAGAAVVQAFSKLGRALGQTWMHVESETVNAHHFKVS